MPGAGPLQRTCTYASLHSTLLACRRWRMCLPRARGGRMHSPSRYVTRRRCGLLPNYFGHLIIQLYTTSPAFTYSLQRDAKNTWQKAHADGAVATVKSYRSSRRYHASSVNNLGRLRYCRDVQRAQPGYSKPWVGCVDVFYWTRSEIQ